MLIQAIFQAQSLRHLGLIALGSALGAGMTMTLQQEPQQEPPPRNRLKTPKEISFDLLLKQEPILGSETAPLTIVEFSDYQCPYCRIFQNTIFPNLKKDFIDKGLVRLIHKDLPLPFHKQAEMSAIVARCAKRQNAFWVVHQALYDQQNCLECKGPRAIAISAGLNERELNRCLRDPKLPELIRTNKSEAGLHNITATPTFVIGPTVAVDRHRGFLVEGALPWPQFSRIIDSELLSIQADKHNEQRHSAE